MAGPEIQRVPCPMCGEKIAATARKCRFCGEAVTPAVTPAVATRSTGAEEEGDSTGGVIPYKNMPALFGYYCGVFSIIPCFPIGIAGLVLGIMGLRKAKENPKVRGQAHAWIGIIVGGLFGLFYLGITLLVIVGIIAESR